MVHSNISTEGLKLQEVKKYISYKGRSQSIYLCAIQLYVYLSFSIASNNSSVFLALALMSSNFAIRASAPCSTTKKYKYSKFPKISKVSDKMAYANSADPDQTAPE